MVQRCHADSGLSHVGSVNAPLVDAEREGEIYSQSRGADSLEALRKLSAADLMKAAPQGVRFRPVVDGWFLTKPPAEAIEQGPGSDVPLLSGYQAQDGRSLSRPPVSLQTYEERLRAIYGSMADEAMELYSVTGPEGIAAASEAMSQDRNRVSQWIMATERNKTHKSATYTYLHGPCHPMAATPGVRCHTGELPYAFANLDKLDRPWTDKDREVSRVLSGYLIAFTKTGSPYGTGLPVWLKAAGAKQTMELGERFSPMPLASPKREAFWMKFLTSPDAAKSPIF